MPIFQAFNKRNNSWVKYSKYGNKVKILDVKEKEPKKKFKGVPVRMKIRSNL